MSISRPKPSILCGGGGGKKLFGYIFKIPSFSILHSLRREYPPLSLLQLQTLIDTNRLDDSKPIDLTALLNTGIYRIIPYMKHAGVQLTDEVNTRRSIIS